MQSGKPKNGKKSVQVLQQILEIVGQTVRTIQFGTVTLIVQDGVIIQLEKHEKIRLDNTNPAQKLQSRPDSGHNRTNPDFSASILESLKDLQYGQLVILIKDGNVTQVDRTAKQRIASWQGLNGEGI